jgi:DnaJ-class molecular chaperone
MAKKIAESVEVCPSCKGSGMAVRDGIIVDCPRCKGECVISKKSE